MTFRSLLVALFLTCSVPCWGQHLDPQFLGSLEVMMAKANATDSEFHTLLNEAMTRAQTTSIREFLSAVSWCPPSRDHAGITQTKTSQALFLFNRDLEEPQDQSPRSLKAFYLAQVRENLPKDIPAKDLQWDFEPDMVVTSRFESQREICLRQGTPVNDALEFMAHELVHYARTPDVHVWPSVERYKTALDYARDMILQPGDEVDAYLFQFSYVIRTKGLAELRAPAGVGRAFNEKGVFLGRRQDLVSPILEDLGYYKIRLRPEFEKALQTQLQSIVQRLNFARQLATQRQTQIASFQEQLQTRSKVLNFLWPSYRSDTDRLNNLLASARLSSDRLETVSLQAGTKCRELLARLNIPPTPTLACTLPPGH